MKVVTSILPLADPARLDALNTEAHSANDICQPHRKKPGGSGQLGRTWDGTCRDTRGVEHGTRVPQMTLVISLGQTAVKWPGWPGTRRNRTRQLPHLGAGSRRSRADDIGSRGTPYSVSSAATAWRTAVKGSLGSARAAVSMRSRAGRTPPKRPAMVSKTSRSVV
jgi:hypothetical protein